MPASYWTPPRPEPDEGAWQTSLNVHGTGILSLLGLIGVLIYAVVKPTASGVRPGGGPDLQMRASLAVAGVLVMCVFGLIEHLLRPEWRARGWKFLAGPMGVACYFAAALVLRLMDDIGKAIVQGGHADAQMGLVVFLPLVLGLVLGGVALGVAAIRAGAVLWGRLATMFIPVLLVFYGLFGLATEVRSRYYTPEDVASANAGYGQFPRPALQSPPPVRNAPRSTYTAPSRQQETLVVSSAGTPGRRKGAVDYSPYVTLVRDQSVTGLDSLHSTAAVVDIIKERERSYTPDVSAGFLAYAYHVSGHYYRDDARIRIPQDGQTGVVRDLGAATEATHSSRSYDPGNLYARPTCPEEVPKDDAFAEAHWLQIADHSRTIFRRSAGLEPLKAVLERGPVIVWYHARCMALIGYDDSRSRFTLVDSRGEVGPDRGFVYWTCKEMLDRQGETLITAVTNAPTPRDAYPYVARIHVLTPAGRDNLTVRVGLDGERPATVWAPAPHGARDRGQALLIDVPLPDYAARHWPPSPANRWYVEVSYPGQRGGALKAATLVRRGFTGDGRYRPACYRLASALLPIPPDKPLKAFAQH